MCKNWPKHKWNKICCSLIDAQHKALSDGHAHRSDACLHISERLSTRPTSRPANPGVRTPESPKGKASGSETLLASTRATLHGRHGASDISSSAQEPELKVKSCYKGTLLFHLRLLNLSPAFPWQGLLGYRLLPFKKRQASFLKAFFALWVSVTDCQPCLSNFVFYSKCYILVNHIVCNKNEQTGQKVISEKIIE